MTSLETFTPNPYTKGMARSTASSEYLNKVIDLQEQDRCKVIARTDQAAVYKVEGDTANYMVTVIPQWAADGLGLYGDQGGTEGLRWSCTCMFARAAGYESKPCSHAMSCIMIFDGAHTPFTKGTQ